MSSQVMSDVCFEEDKELQSVDRRGFAILSKFMHTLFVNYLQEGRVRAPKETNLTELVKTFKGGAKRDRRALQSKFKSWSRRMAIRKSDKALVLGSTGKVIAPLEDCQSIVLNLHFNNISNHLTVREVSTEVQKHYTWGRKDFGMDWDTVANIIRKGCKLPACQDMIMRQFYREKTCHASNTSRSIMHLAKGNKTEVFPLPGWKTEIRNPASLSIFSYSRKGKQRVYGNKGKEAESTKGKEIIKNVEEEDHGQKFLEDQIPPTQRKADSSAVDLTLGTFKPSQLKLPAKEVTSIDNVRNLSDVRNPNQKLLHSKRGDFLLVTKLLKPVLTTKSTGDLYPTAKISAGHDDFRKGSCKQFKPLAPRPVAVPCSSSENVATVVPYTWSDKQMSMKRPIPCTLSKSSIRGKESKKNWGVSGYAVEYRMQSTQSLKRSAGDDVRTTSEAKNAKVEESANGDMPKMNLPTYYILQNNPDGKRTQMSSELLDSKTLVKVIMPTGSKNPLYQIAKPLVLKPRRMATTVEPQQKTVPRSFEGTSRGKESTVVVQKKTRKNLHPMKTRVVQLDMGPQEISRILPDHTSSNFKQVETRLDVEADGLKTERREKAGISAEMPQSGELLMKTFQDTMDGMMASIVRKVGSMRSIFLQVLANEGRGKTLDALKSQIVSCDRTVRRFKSRTSTMEFAPER